MKKNAQILSLLLAALLLLTAAAPSAFAEEPRYHFASETLSNLYAIDTEGNVSVLIDSGDGWADVVPSWDNIQTLDSGDCFIAGLKKDGTAICSNEDIMKEIAAWHDLVQVVGFYNRVLGLRSDGTVVSAGGPWSNWIETAYDFSGWTGITKLVYGRNPEGQTIFGLREDGTVLDSKYEYDDEDPSFQWFGEPENVVDLVSDGHEHVALRSDGTVVCMGGSDVFYLAEAMKAWTDVVQLTIVDGMVVGLRSDGSLLCTNEEAELSPEAGWNDIKAIYSSDYYADHLLVAVRNDGRVKAFTRYSLSEPNESDWVREIESQIIEIESWEDVQGCYVCDSAVIGWHSDGSYCAVGFDPALLN